ncbi:MAG TPA: polysaccharide deacetylase family protein [Gemmatimonadaceae bacterium]
MTPPCILCYHKVDRRVELGVTRLSPRRFARQIERLARTGRTTLSLSELRACLTGARRPAPHEIAITFDDGYRALRDHAFPVLAAHGFTAICFVVTDYAGKLNRWDVAYGGRRFAHLAWRDMRRWQSRGVEFASHTATHPRLTWLADADVSRELAQSRADLRAALDIDPSAMSWPFGAHAQRERAIAQREGYDLAFTIGRAGIWKGDLFAVPRHPVYMWSPPLPGVGHLALAEALAGAMANRCAVGTSFIQRRARVHPY